MGGSEGGRGREEGVKGREGGGDREGRVGREGGKGGREGREGGRERRSERCSYTVSDDNRVIRPKTQRMPLTYRFLVIKKKVDAANSEHQQWPQTLSVWLAIVRCWHVSSPFCDVIERRACETFK